MSQSFRQSRLVVSLIMLVFALTVAPLSGAQQFTVLHNFIGGSNDGAEPGASMTADKAGNLYGSTIYGGDLSCTGLEAGGGGSPPGCGVLFKVKKSGSGWIFDPLYIFPGNLQGYLPSYPGGLVIGPNGSLYGVNTFGGNGIGVYGAGDVFSANPGPTAQVSALTSWSYNVIYEFQGNTEPLDGANPTRSAPLIYDAAGNLYGTTDYGDSFSAGVVYKLTPSGNGWTESLLYSFLGGSDGANPRGVTFDEAGNLYGVTTGGGSGCGLIFELTPSGSGWTKTTLYVFRQGIDGCSSGALIRDKAGNLYGITEEDGPLNDGGTVWELSPSNGSWTFSVLYAFPAPTVGYYGPYQLTMDSDGNLYGITSWGGANNTGFIFKLTPSNGGWTYTDLYDFEVRGGTSGGCYGIGTPLLDPQGNIYGLAQLCGQFSLGTVWKFTP